MTMVWKKGTRNWRKKRDVVMLLQMFRKGVVMEKSLMFLVGHGAEKN